MVKAPTVSAANAPDDEALIETLRESVAAWREAGEPIMDARVCFVTSTVTVRALPPQGGYAELKERLLKEEAARKAEKAEVKKAKADARWRAKLEALGLPYAPRFRARLPRP